MNPIVSQADPAPRDAAPQQATGRPAPKRHTAKAGTATQPARRRVRVAQGIYKDRHGLAATVKVKGIQREIRFPPGTSLKTIRARRDELRASHWTGMRPSQMGRLTLADFHLQDPIPYVSVPRGKRGRLAAVPLVDEAVAAARAFIANEAFGAWSTPSANKAIRTAAQKVGLEPFTVYQIRHSFATWLRPPGPTLRTSRTCTGTPTRRQRGSTRRPRSRSSATPSGAFVL